MALDLLRDCTFFGPALPEPFVKFELEKHLRERQLLPRADGAEGRALQERWEMYRRKLRALGEQGGDLRVASHVLAPLTERLGYVSFERQTEVGTREGLEDGGWLMSGEGSTLRCWSVELGTDLDAPNLRGRAYRFSPARVAQRVLLAQGERMGLLTDGQELRILHCDPARPDSHIAIRLDQSNGWRAASEAPDSYRLLLALASPSGTKALPELTEAARLAQATITRKLRVQARRAIEDFIQSVLDQPANAHVRATTDTAEMAQTLWREGLVLVYRLLFIFKLESAADPARAFSFAATSLWRNTYSPNVALASLVRKVLDDGAETGGLLEEGLRVLWRMFARGLSSRELQVSALGGMLFGEGTTPLLNRLHWGETAVAKLLDALLWTLSEGRGERERVHYGALDVEDLGRVYEALLELEPGFAIEPMCRLRRAKLEVVVPAAQGERYRSNPAGEVKPDHEESESAEDAEGEEEEVEFSRKRSNAGGKTSIQFIESIPKGRFYLRVGLGRKASGSYYTPHPFVRFLVQETLGPQVSEQSPQDDPQPGRLLDLKVLDPAMGSGHFLVEACRFLGEALYEACRLCDELALQAEDQAAKASEIVEQVRLRDHSHNLRKRVEDLPDPDNELVAYLPSRILEGQESGPSQRKAQALCRRLVAVHCLYGVDKNLLAVELSKLSLWLESYAEGLPLTFLDHRLICGDSLTGSFSEHLSTYPRSQEEIRGLFVQGLTARLEEAISSALAYVQDLEASVGKDLSDLARKCSANEQLENALHPLRLLAAAWAGGVMLEDDAADTAYVDLLRAVVEHDDILSILEDNPTLTSMVKAGAKAVCYDLAFPEAFHPAGNPKRVGGFHAVLGNPPWDTLRPLTKEFFASFDLDILNAPTKREREIIERRIKNDGAIGNLYAGYVAEIEYQRRIFSRLYIYQRSIVDGRTTGGDPDLAKYFAERTLQLTRASGLIGVVLPAAVHVASGAAALRRLYLENAEWRILYSFHNALSLFEVETKVKFSLIVVKNCRLPDNPIRCRFRQKHLGSIFDLKHDLIFQRKFIHAMGGPYLTFPELESLASVDTLHTISNASEGTLSDHCQRKGIRFGSELHATSDSWRVAPTQSVVSKVDPRDGDALERLIGRGFLVVANEDSLHQYDDHWKDAPRYLAPLVNLKGKEGWLRATQYYRLFYRRIANVVDLRSFKATLVPPGWLSASPFVNRTPWSCSYAQQLLLLAVLNSYCLDWSLRLRLSATLSQFIVDSLPIPHLEPLAMRLLSHGSLRLTCNHAGYAHLWREQVGEAWREKGSPRTWPTITSKTERWGIRAAIDAAVAQSFKLSRDQYAYVLSTFSHKGYIEAPDLCLAAFDELNSSGLDDFAKRHDPYWDVPLNDDLPKPVINLPRMRDHNPGIEENGQFILLTGGGSSASSRVGPGPSLASPNLESRQDHSEDAYQLISAFLAEHGEITSRDAQDLTDLDANAVRPYLERLLEEGLAVKKGQRRGTKYRKTEADA